MSLLEEAIAKAREDLTPIIERMKFMAGVFKRCRNVWLYRQMVWNVEIFIESLEQCQECSRDKPRSGILEVALSLREIDAKAAKFKDTADLLEKVGYTEQSKGLKIISDGLETICKTIGKAMEAETII